MSNPVFSKTSQEKVASPEQLNDYIKVSSVGVWIVLAVVLILLISAFVWGAFGSLKTTVAATGVVQDGAAVCYVENADQIEVGDPVRINDTRGKVTAIAQAPVSAESVAAQYDEYTAYRLQPADWSYAVEIECAGCEDGVQTVKIICDTVKPLSFLAG
ncbi:MAG: hypothetical protein IJK64_07475 [Clostridia bacterium]|nr:hypothetical protein [Clostridia bacterium]